MNKLVQMITKSRAPLEEKGPETTLWASIHKPPNLKNVSISRLPGTQKDYTGNDRHLELSTETY